MIQRCTKDSCRAYRWYGAKGIKVDPRWLDYNEFLKDMGEKPQGMTLDRKDHSKNYTAANCRWSSWHVQQANRSNNNETVGVAMHKASGKWRAYIKPKDRQISLGYYDNYRDAVAARKKAEKDLDWW